METVVTLTHRRPDSVGLGASPAPADVDRTLTVRATYLLSEDGRKASLLMGGDGREVQQLAIDVPANRLHLVSVDANGVARLRLRPRYQLDDQQRALRIDTAPMYDVPPTIEDLFHDAARNHQLERTFETQRRETKTKRRDAQRDRKTQLAQAFVDDPTQRAIVHPPPTPRSCYLATPQGRVLFDAKIDLAPAADVPKEAHRRFRADLRATRERNLQQRAAQQALHEEKKAFIAEWIAAHGTPDQQARQAAGVLPMDEAIEAMTDEAFAVLADRLRYEHDGHERLQAHVRRFPEQADAVIARTDLLVTSTDAKAMTAPQWAVVQEIQRLLPESTVTLRSHKVAWKRDPKVALEPLFGVLVTQRVGPFTLRREYVAE
jgi:hypothetical protein